jgi:hypothetical protein
LIDLRQMNPIVALLIYLLLLTAKRAAY